MKFKLLMISGMIAIFAIQSSAHHSFAMFDKEKLVTVTGTLKSFEWTNPHCWLHIVAEIGRAHV